MLKGKPESVDLILTEVDLPSISRYALLITVMSTHDSVNTVYKCMLRGAADYLVKPLRRNELRNLWQHVWRRQSSLAPHSFPLNESVGPQKPEGASANNSISNNGNVFERDEHPVVGNGGDAQSTCTRPEMEGESADVEVNPRASLQMESTKSLFNETHILRNEMQSKRDYLFFRQKKIIRIKLTHLGVYVNSSKEAFDFMGASIRRNGQRNREESVAQVESPIDLDLSLRRPNASERRFYFFFLSYFRHGSFDQRGDIATSGIALASKTMVDVLKELKSYKEMKNVLLS